MPIFFDAHLDLGAVTVRGRDMTATLEALEPDERGETIASPGPHPPAAVTLPSLNQGGVRFALATIFTQADGDDETSYPAGDAERAHAVARAQLEVYRTWADQKRVAIDLKRICARDRGIGAVRGGMGVSEPVPEPIERRVARLPVKPPLHIGILMESADPIRTPDELAWWAERGVVAVGMAWWRDSRYARGNGADASDRVGITDMGRDLAQAMDGMGIVHDLSHLSQRAVDDLLALTDRPVIVSHSNCRALLGGERGGSWQRHVSDETIREVARRGGVIGVNLVANFIRDGISEGERPTIGELIAHVEHVCEIAGSRAHVGLGTDMDGGFSAAHLPQGIDRPADLHRICDALQERGWSRDDLDGFTHLNWLRFFERCW